MQELINILSAGTGPFIRAQEEAYRTALEAIMNAPRELIQKQRDMFLSVGTGLASPFLGRVFGDYWRN
jgi:hypothetical protein